LGAVAAIAAGHASMTAADRAFMQRFWAAGFAPLPPHAWDLVWPLAQIESAFGVFSTAPPALDGGLHYRDPVVFTILAGIGAWSLWRRDRDVALFVGLPIAAAIAAAIVHLYPLSGRLAVFLIPYLLLAVAAAGEDLQRFAQRFVGVGGLIVPGMIAAVALQAIVRNPPPDRQEDMKRVLSYVRDHRAASDSMYVYYGAGQAFLYYADRYSLPAARFSVGSCARHDPRTYLNELDRFRREARVWVIFAHSLQGGKEIRFLTHYLDRIGRRVDAVPPIDAPLGAGAYAFLYDLSDPQRLSNAAADAYALPSDEPDTSWLCYGTMSPVIAP
jgi:hypothetical protein